MFIPHGKAGLKKLKAWLSTVFKVSKWKKFSISIAKKLFMSNGIMEEGSV